LEEQKEDLQKMITTDTKNELGITVAKDLRTVMQGKVAIAGEASYEGAPVEALDCDFNPSWNA
jgi:hypothetical protein